MWKWRRTTLACFWIMFHWWSLSSLFISQMLIWRLSHNAVTSDSFWNPRWEKYFYLRSLPEAFNFKLWPNGQRLICWFMECGGKIGGNGKRRAAERNLQWPEFRPTPFSKQPVRSNNLSCATANKAREYTRLLGSYHSWNELLLVLLSSICLVNYYSRIIQIKEMVPHV